MQSELFEHTVKGPMSGFLGGKNVLIFSYGVTNAGKTHTIQGEDPKRRLHGSVVGKLCLVLMF